MTSNEQRSERWERCRPRNWSLAFKLIAVLIVPVIMAQGLLVLRIVEQIQDAQRLGGNERLIDLQDRFSSLVGQLQRERDDSAVFVAAGRTGDASMQKTGFGAVDGSLAEIRAAVGDPASMGEAPAEAYAGALLSLSKLESLRSQVTGSVLPITSVVSEYTAIIQPVLQLGTALGRQLEQAEPSSLPSALDGLARAREQVAQQNALVAAAITRRSLPVADAEAIRATDIRLDAAVADVRGSLDAESQDKYLGFVAGPANVARKQIEQKILSKAGATAPLVEDLAQWDAAYEAVLTEVTGGEKQLRDQVSTRSAGQQDQAKNLAGIYSAVLLLASVLGTTLLVLVWRTLLRSLRTLRGTALDVAQRRLPEAVQNMRDGGMPNVMVEPVPVTTREEIGQVARAFDAVHSQAVRLAAEQATLQAGVSSMFVNLSRRSQGLVERQLQLIEQLESNEQDPDQLANLFQLDHLATRMRRNSESLLVLAGSDSSRRSSQPVPVIDVLRAAVSEVEQYQRVVVQPPPPVKILGRTAADLVHLLAELLDNATNFSAPDTQVVMSSTRTEDGSVLIEIADRGVGMASAELAEANDRLSGPSQVDVSASRRMGLFVVGRLASRHGIGVRLGGPTPGASAAGVTASVSVPSYLVPVVEGAVIDDSVRVGPGGGRRPEPAANGGGRIGSLSALVASGNSVSGPPANGNSNGFGGQGGGGRTDQGWPPQAPQSPQLPPQRGPIDRPLAPPRLAPPSAPRPTDPGRAPAAPQWAAPPPQSVPTPVSQATDTAPPRTPIRSPDSQGYPMVAGPPPAMTVEPAVRPPIAPPPSESPPPLARPAGPSGLSPDRTLPPVGGALFAASMPATAEPEATPAPPPVTPRRPMSEPPLTERRDMSEATPIFEEIASAWFQAQRPVPVDWADLVEGEDDAAVEAPTTDTDWDAPQPLSGEFSVSLEPPIMRPAPQPAQQDEPAHFEQFEQYEQYEQHEQAQDGYWPQPQAEQEPMAPLEEPAASWSEPAPPPVEPVVTPQQPASTEFAGPADQGWLAAQALAGPSSDEPEEFTAAGLPRRRPKARLIPGSAAGAVPAQAAAPPRTADAVRGRLASYQQGVRQGREQRLRRGPEAAGATAGRPSEGYDEENR